MASDSTYVPIYISRGKRGTLTTAWKNMSLQTLLFIIMTKPKNAKFKNDKETLRTVWIVCYDKTYVLKFPSEYGNQSCGNFSSIYEIWSVKQ